jgi:membrane-associated phospholipid phosphatase
MDPAFQFAAAVLAATAVGAVALHLLLARPILASACATAVGIAFAIVAIPRAALTGRDLLYFASAFVIALGVGIALRRGPFVRIRPSVSPGDIGWRRAMELFARPQPVTFSMVALFALVPCYIVIGQYLIPGRTVHVPEVYLDRLIPLAPVWAPVYGSLFLLVILPVFVVHQPDLVRRTVNAYLAIWLLACVIFIVYPTATPRPPQLAGEGFFAWMLRAIYSADVKYNCFPSLHVAQSYLSALACYRVNRGVGLGAGAWATLVALSTLFTKQHYVLDVISGALLAYAAHAVFLRGFPPEAVPALDRRLAPLLAGTAAGVYAVIMAGFGLAYAIVGA